VLWVGSGGDTALSVFVAIVLGGSFVVLAIVCWVFWRAAKRDSDDSPTESAH